ncbi:MAG: hypothetical protein AB7U63_01770 [Porticoccaceae bacterium]
MKNQPEKPDTEKKDDKEQSRRFIETAKELESDESGSAFDRAMGILSHTTEKPAK